MKSIASSDIRRPAVAGTFYPADRRELHDMVEGFLAEWRSDQNPATTPAAMVPHAGLVYSGICAASVFARIELPRTIVIISPNHRGIHRAPRGVSLWPEGAFRTPLGEVPVDSEFCAELLERCPVVADDRDAHLPEHGIEVELPFIQTLSPEAAIVPIAMVPDDWRTCFAVAEILTSMAQERPGQVLVLASSDMTHFESARSAAEKDSMALAALEALDGEKLLQVCRRHHITMCGRAPAAIAARVASSLGAKRARVVDYRHSGMVTGDFDNVVAYAAAIAE